MKEISISFIIPIYNAERYLKKAIDSIVEQMDGSIELILVNDGSTDSSGKICDEYTQKNRNVIVIHLENGGLPFARNMGIRVASGKYISFLDADDYFDGDTYEQIGTILDQYNPDCIDFGWKYINDYEEIATNLSGVPKNKVLSKEVIRKIILPPLLNLTGDKEFFIYDFVWNKIYKRQILEDYNILFDENRKTWEDSPFLLKYLKHCNSFYSMSKCLYNYVSTEDSLSRCYDLQFFDIILENYYQYVEWYGKEYDFNTQYVNNYWCHSIENMIHRSLREEKQKEQIRANIVRIINDEQVVKWYVNREPENGQEKQTSRLVVQGDVEGAIKVYENVVKGQKKREKRNQIKAKIYAVRKVFKS